MSRTQTSWRYRCADCDREHPDAHADYCAGCGAPVLGTAAAASPGPLASTGAGVWRYAAHLPPVEERWRRTLGEAGVPLVEAPWLASELGVGRLYLLCDHLNPTGSFKDRALAVTVADAAGRAAPGVVCASSGNAAGSAAAYAARAGLPAVIVVPERTPFAKMGLARAYGATVLRVPGDYSAAFALGRQLCDELGYVNVSTTYVNPRGVAAYRSVAFDLVRELGDAVDRVVVPTGAGPLVHGVVSGFAYLRARGDVTGVPRVDAVQPAGCAPIVAAFEAAARDVVPWGTVTTAVSGIDDPLRGYPGDGTVTVASVRSTGGVALAVDDEAIHAHARRLAHEAGQFVEPAAASGLAALARLARAGALAAGETAVCLLTGNGLKTLAAHESPLPLVRDVAEARERLGEEH